MRNIVVLGVGRSSHYLLEYLNRKAVENQWHILACDTNLALVQEKVADLPHVSAAWLDVSNTENLVAVVAEAAIVVSLLPPHLHVLIAKQCLQLGKHLATASYVSPEMQSLHEEAIAKKLIFINEAGLDPGIDHMSAMQVMDDLRKQGADIFSFESYCGGLIHEMDCAGNPWKYKFSWNPMNVILAGQGNMSVYRKDNRIRFIPWHRVFATSEKLEVRNLGTYDAYANRDSLSYMRPYGLEHAKTFLRGTLRRENYCAAWQVLVSLGFTDNTTVLPPDMNTPKQLTNALTGKAENEKFADWLLHNHLIPSGLKSHFDFLDMDNDSGNVALSATTAAGKLMQWLGEKWKLEPADRDEVVMVHRVGYKLQGEEQILESRMRQIGENSEHTAMAKTVGLPLAMAVEAVLNGKIHTFGVQTPITENWYRVILPQLDVEGIHFEEQIL